MRPLRFFSVAFLLLLIAGNLFAQRVPLTIEASEGPAQVILDGRLLGIANPKFRAQVSPGRYELLVRKPGLPEFRQRINVGPSGLTVQARLGTAPRPARVSVFISDQILNQNLNSPESKVELYINGSKVNGLSALIEPGRHRLRIVSGGLAFETSITARPGENYTVEPMVNLELR